MKARNRDRRVGGGIGAAFTVDQACSLIRDHPTLLSSDGEPEFRQGASIGDVDEVHIFAVLLFQQIAKRLKLTLIQTLGIQRLILG
jgi:hypothetical protein